MTEEEQYFRDQLKAIKPEGEEVIASGYFRSYLGEGKPTFFSAAAARGHFLALTAMNLFIVKTRASATSKPLLENLGMECIPMDKINGFFIDFRVLGFTYMTSGVTLEMSVKNKYFSSQQYLIDSLAQRFNVETDVSDIISAKRKDMMIRVLLIIITLTIVTIYGIKKSNQGMDLTR